MNKRRSLKEAKLSLFLFSDAFPRGDQWKRVCFVPVAGHFAGKKLLLVLVRGATRGNVLPLSLYFISGKKMSWRGAVKLRLSLGRGPCLQRYEFWLPLNKQPTSFSLFHL